MEKRFRTKKESRLKTNPRCPRDQEINILLLGQTGVGKSTFINAFVNYMVNDTLNEAVNDEMQVIIPSSFFFTTYDTFDEKMIVIGEEDEHEKFRDIGQSNTQQCRSFIFPIGDRNLRFIDTPGIGDTRSLEQDAKNFQEILTYIAQYKHLNAVFFLLKPNEERLTILFRFCINELLRHLHVGAKDNIIFVFTNARSTFFVPGSTKRLLKELLDKHREEQNVDVPFSMDNTFLFDNEPFRYLALRKNGIQLDEEQTLSYNKSWDHSVNEYARLMAHIATRPPHRVSKTLSLNEAEQLIQKLSRPIAETAKLIEENIQLAKEYKNKMLDNPEIASQGIPQNNATIVDFRHPQTVCIGERCCRVFQDGNETKMEYLSMCHEECYLKGVVQEKISDLQLKECEAMNPDNGLCLVCGCNWRQHKHTTYDCNTYRTRIGSNKEMSLNDIDQHINNLREEENKIQDVYKKLVRFLHANAILPINDDFPEYLRYFLREEQMKQSAGAHNTEIITNLEKMMTDFMRDMELFKKTIHDERNSDNATENLRPEDIFILVSTLYQLPINGKLIREQIDEIEFSQEKYNTKREVHVDLPVKAVSSKVMLQLKNIVSQ
ncbi:unnamed protein product [Rotaria sp. Silwood2]|nr:unnamed protein product [Rotaria sp. Silwood2]CAF4113892.1 unnamed protein product [Rotaria sp. Silwood2]